ncbi:hypothetical protein JG688_00016031 [Phytophthora aleatoria]|uniref:Uncharacterized protein n=1 Tax=Phytophthora aleatoria TaxID=2496075 RepID=A0A8J5ISF6_9STRA|nr:hypothetical protein JG688_00016031 [Phytophthora aleatoria]
MLRSQSFRKVRTRYFVRGHLRRLKLVTSNLKHGIMMRGLVKVARKSHYFLLSTLRMLGRCFAHTGLSAKLKVPANASTSYRVVVSGCGGKHNHERGPRVYKHYPESRRIKSDSLLANVDEMRKSGTKAKGILFYLREISGTWITKLYRTSTKRVPNTLTILMQRRQNSDAQGCPQHTRPAEKPLSIWRNRRSACGGVLAGRVRQ